MTWYHLSSRSVNGDPSVGIKTERGFLKLENQMIIALLGLQRPGGTLRFCPWLHQTETVEVYRGNWEC